jgi:CRP-like cAMP-binding protein
LDAKVPGLTANRSLAALPRDDFKLLENQFSVMPMTQRTLLFNAGDEVEHVTFPLSGWFRFLWF